MENNNQNEQLRKAIFRTVAFFDMFNYPLTAFEIWKYLGVKCELGEVVEFLNQLHSSSLPACADRLCKERGQNEDSDTPQPLSRGELQQKNGFYFLKGREEIIETRMRRYNYTDEKFKRALWVSRIFKYIPWIKGIAIGNIIGAHNLKKEGDIDFFIITQKNRIWITRFYCVLIAKLLGLRPKPGKIKDKICLSFFISEDNLNLERLMLNSCYSEQSEESRDPSAKPQDDKGKDVYFIHWLAGLIPIYNEKEIFEKFFQANNWIKEYLPNWISNEIHFRRDAGKIPFTFLCNNLGGVREKLLRWLQLRLLPKELQELRNKDTRVIINDQMIKTHSNDRREYYKEQFLKYKNIWT